jgi:hypothetical protein
VDQYNIEGIEGLTEEDDLKVGTLNKGRVTINSELRTKLDVEDGKNVAMWIENEEKNLMAMKIIDENLIKEMLQ